MTLSMFLNELNKNKIEERKGEGREAICLEIALLLAALHPVVSALMLSLGRLYMHCAKRAPPSPPALSF